MVLKFMSNKLHYLAFLKCPELCYFNENSLVVGEAAVVGSSLCRLVPRMSQLTLGVAVAQSELCYFNENSWSNEQNKIATHWDSFVSIYHFAV